MRQQNEELETRLKTLGSNFENMKRQKNGELETRLKTVGSDFENMKSSSKNKESALEKKEREVQEGLQRNKPRERSSVYDGEECGSRSRPFGVYERMSVTQIGYRRHFRKQEPRERSVVVVRLPICVKCSTPRASEDCYNCQW